MPDLVSGGWLVCEGLVAEVLPMVLRLTLDFLSCFRNAKNNEAAQTFVRLEACVPFAPLAPIVVGVEVDKVGDGDLGCDGDADFVRGPIAQNFHNRDESVVEAIAEGASGNPMAERQPRQDYYNIIVVFI